MNFAIATFCYGERYYKQVNRMIESIDILDNKPKIFIVTDNINSINKKNFVHVEDISNYNFKYKNYEPNNYYSFDFSVKRFSLRFALDSGFSKIILSDADAMANPKSFSETNILKCFKNNSVSGPVNYNLKEHLYTNSMLGNRFLYYEKIYNVNFDKDILVSEDCIQYFDIDTEKFYTFLNIWDECIKIKDRDNLPNIPAGNIDEISFSALYNKISLYNNSDVSAGILNAHHDTWYR